MRYAGLVEAQARIKIARRNINNLRYADDTTFMAESPWGREDSDTTERRHFHFSLSSLSFIKRLFSCSWLSAMLLSHFSRVRPHRRQPTRLPRPWDSPGKNTGVGCHFLLQCVKVKSESEVAQSCPTLSDPMDCRLPGSSVHGIFQARVLEWGAIAFSIVYLNK